MAIFSLHHAFIGRTTHPAGAAASYAKYIMRPEVCSQTVGSRMPTTSRELQDCLTQQEQSDRKNARVIDKVVVALPLELDHEQRVELLKEFGERMTEGRAAWVAAIHDGEADADNPHAHIIIRDRDFETGRRVLLTTEAGSTQRIRDGWEQELNIALQRAGIEQQVSGKSLADQGIDREPQIHVGAGAMELAKRQHEFTSNAHETTRIIDGQITDITVNYPVIDGGKSRYQENQERLERNAARASEIDGWDLHWTHRGGMYAQQMSAMAWVRAADIWADRQYLRAMGEAVDDPTDYYAASAQQDFSAESGIQRAESSRRETANRVPSPAADLSDLGSAMRSEAEQLRERGRGLHLEP